MADQINRLYENLENELRTFKATKKSLETGLEQVHALIQKSEALLENEAKILELHESLKTLHKLEAEYEVELRKLGTTMEQFDTILVRVSDLEEGHKANSRKQQRYTIWLAAVSLVSLLAFIVAVI